MKRIRNILLLIIAFCAIALAQTKPQIRYPGSTREAALRCPGAGCIGTVTASPGDQVEFWVAGANLAGVTGIEFQPGDGIEVTKIQATSETMSAALTVSQGAALGKRRFVVTSPAGTSNEIVGELNISTFRISSLKVDNVVNSNGTLTFRVSFNYADPTGSVSSGPLDIQTSLNFAGRVIGGIGSAFNPEGRTPGATTGVISFTRAYENMQGTTGAIFTISLGARHATRREERDYEEN